jgi:hypothetical protein
MCEDIKYQRNHLQIPMVCRLSFPEIIPGYFSIVMTISKIKISGTKKIIPAMECQKIILFSEVVPCNYAYASERLSLCHPGQTKSKHGKEYRAME